MATKINGIKVQVVEPGLLEVQSFTNPNKVYVVDLAAKTCSCPDFKFRGRKCKHLTFVEEHESLIRLETAFWESNRKFQEWRRSLVAEKLRKFKSLDGETVKKMRRCGLEYDEDLSALVWGLIMG